jgi:hypothetical protein
VSTPAEWNLLKNQFDLLVHDEIVGADSIEKTFDEQVLRRFAEMINRAAERGSRTGKAGRFPRLREDLKDEPT